MSLPHHDKVSNSQLKKINTDVEAQVSKRKCTGRKIKNILTVPSLDYLRKLHQVPNAAANQVHCNFRLNRILISAAAFTSNATLELHDSSSSPGLILFHHLFLFFAGTIPSFLVSRIPDHLLHLFSSHPHPSRCLPSFSFFAHT